MRKAAHRLRTDRKQENRTTQEIAMKAWKAQHRLGQFRKVCLELAVALVVLLGWSATAHAQLWIPIFTPPQFNVGIALQLTDGTIMVQENKTSNWWKLSRTSTAFTAAGLGPRSRPSPVP